MEYQNLQPERLSLLKFFYKIPNSQFVIPVYQRNYIWTSKKQVKKLLDDFSNLLNGNKNAHFLGIMMYLSIPKGIGFNELSVVDGQQRLITIFLILQCLKEIGKENGNDEFSEKVEQLFLTNKYTKEESQKLKLKPLISEDNVYSKITYGNIAEIDKEEKKSNVYINYCYIKEYIKELYGKYSIDFILDTLDKFYFVAIPLGGEDNAQEIFETINSAGAELTKSDLIRNYILMNIPSEEQERLYENYWRSIEILFEKNGKIENFFRMFLANKIKELPNMEDIYIEFQQWFSVENKSRSVEEILKEIYMYAKYYEILFISKNFDISPKINKVLKEFKKSTMEPTAPLLMEIFNLYNKKDINGNSYISEDNFANIISLFNTYNLRRNICNLRTGVLTRIIPPMLKDILNACNGNYENIYNICVKYLVDNNRQKASFMPDDAYLRANLSSINAYSLKNYLKIVFEKIESYNNPAVVNFDNLSIEHIMPQTATPEWLQMLNINADVYDYQLHRLGNLTLATHSDNSKMSNNPFEYKKKILSDTSHLKMNEEILSKDGWDIEDIEKRTKSLIEKICEVYPYQTYEQEEIVRYNIFYKNEDTLVSAYLYEDLSVEIIADSYFENNTIIVSEIESLIEEEILSEKGNGYIFNETYTFESLKKASELIINNSSNVWEEWQDSEGNALNFELRARLINRKRSSKR